MRKRAEAVRSRTPPSALAALYQIHEYCVNMYFVHYIRVAGSGPRTSQRGC
jgi:hypothetical protein